MDIKLEKEYIITYKSWPFNRTFLTSVSVEDIKEKVKDSDKEFILKELNKFNLNISDVFSSAVLFFQRSRRIIHNFHGELTRVMDINGDTFLVFKIFDICLNNCYRGKGIGSQLLKVLDNMAQENNIKYIVGELENDVNIEKRKRFFEKNGYKLFQNLDIEFSGWGIIKTFNKNN